MSGFVVVVFVRSFVSALAMLRLKRSAKKKNNKQTKFHEQWKDDKAKKKRANTLKHTNAQNGNKVTVAFDYAWSAQVFGAVIRLSILFYNVWHHEMAPDTSSKQSTRDRKESMNEIA